MFKNVKMETNNSKAVSVAKQTIHMQYQALLSLTNKQYMTNLFYDNACVNCCSD